MSIKINMEKCSLEASDTLEANQPPKRVVKSFTPVTAVHIENLEIPLDDLQMFKRMPDAESDVKILPPTVSTVEIEIK